jgi:hypothetical protein
LIVVCFVAVWLTIPGGRYEFKNLTTGEWQLPRIAFPARLSLTSCRHGVMAATLLPLHTVRLVVAGEVGRR